MLVFLWVVIHGQLDPTLLYFVICQCLQIKCFLVIISSWNDHPPCYIYPPIHIIVACVFLFLFVNKRLNSTVACVDITLRIHIVYRENNLLWSLTNKIILYVIVSILAIHECGDEAADKTSKKHVTSFTKSYSARWRRKLHVLVSVT